MTSSPSTLRRLTWEPPPGHNDARSRCHIQTSLRERQPGRNQCSFREESRPCRQRSCCSDQWVSWRPTSISHTNSVNTFARSELDEELQQRERTEQEQRLCRKKEEAWELYLRQPTLKRKTRENFDMKFREKVLGVMDVKKKTCSCG